MIKIRSEKYASKKTVKIVLTGSGPLERDADFPEEYKRFLVLFPRR